ncbi:Pol polyprotein [Plakobranchus ocellatus]|uniref:Pol polyprotein n=1 Tax=Plakobranchus ocellatus TaxID=259542 RepID=A0AAV4AY60_9GAST|nr:Pol polyprotein [Plakobranchus ocellatus]
MLTENRFEWRNMIASVCSRQGTYGCELNGIGLVLGIQDKELSQNLQVEATLTLKSAVTTAIEFEVVQLEFQEQRGTTAAALHIMNNRNTRLRAHQVVLRAEAEGAKPYSVLIARRVPFPQQGGVREELNHMEMEGIIQPVTEPPWCTPMGLMVKPNGQIRIYVDYKQLNMVAKRPKCMPPNLNNNALKMAESTIVSTLDATSHFFQILIQDKSRLLSTFNTLRAYYICVPVGISLDSECFQAKMKGLEGCEAIIHGVMVSSEVHTCTGRSSINLGSFVFLQ